VVMAVQQGLISFEEACERYNLSLDEYLRWQRAFEQYEVQGSLAMRIQRDRD
jgi:hypothetical protein